MTVVDGGLATALVGRYEIERELGHGGMAIVYLARDLKHGRMVAIKVLPPELATSLGAERFLREISIAARLTHPNILALHDSISERGMLGYVMPYVDGESLAQRVKREGPLPVEEAVGIARQVAAALDYAHAQGVVHRDVKPENILLVGEQALVADFGLARAIHTASNTPLTQSGIAVGTPAYMSPEQAAADRAVDGRADVYSLACVLFEAVAGVPPFRGSSAQGILAQHATRKPPSLCAERESCPKRLDEAVQRALAKAPADRYRTAGEFGRALARAFEPESPSRRRWRWGGAAAVAVVAVTGIAEQRRSAGALSLEPARYVVMPFAAGDSAARRAADRVSERLGEWTGLDVVDAREAADARQDGGAERLGDILRVAARLHASRAVLVDASTVADSTVVHATLYESATGKQLRTHTITYPARSTATQRFRELANAMLRDSPELPWSTADADRHASLVAWMAYDNGRVALRRWQLATAEQYFGRAIRDDAKHAQAQLWLAQVGAWRRPEQPSAWRDAARSAVALSDQLAPRDTLLARAVAALATLSYPEACDAYAHYRDLAPRDPVGWFGLGQCQSMDPIVVRDTSSPSGWRFRGSFHSAVAAYDSAIHRAEGTPAFAFRRLERLLFTLPSRIRDGRRVAPDTATFAGYPALVADTLAIVPWPAADISAGAVHFDRSTRAAALRVNSERLGAALEEWVRRDTLSADARELLARVQEVRGDRDGDALLAARTVGVARRLSTDPAQQLDLAVAQLRLLAKDADFARARALADSLLAANARAPAGQAALLAGAAVPAPVAAAADRYLVLASLGVCDPEVRGMDGAIDALLARYVAADARAALRRSVLHRPQSLAVPCLGAPVALEAGHTPDALVRMQQALAQKRPAAIRLEFEALAGLRSAIRPGDVSLDRTLQEAWLLAAIRDSAGAEQRLDLPLTALATLSTNLLTDVPQAAALGRAMAFRADLAAARGDSATARRWARNVVVLWGGASPSLRATVERMRGLAGAR